MHVGDLREAFEESNLDIRPADLETVRRILSEHVPALEVRAFGSRVAWHARETSDLDLALMTDKPLTVARMADLRAAFTDADLPFRVDIVDWASTSESFRKVVEAEYAVLDCNRGSATAHWISLTLADACSAIDYGLTASASTQRSGPRFLRITDIVSGQIDWTSVPYVAVNDGTSEKYRLHRRNRHRRQRSAPIPALARYRSGLDWTSAIRRSQRRHQRNTDS